MKQTIFRNASPTRQRHPNSAIKAEKDFVIVSRDELKDLITLLADARSSQMSKAIIKLDALEAALSSLSDRGRA